MDFYKILRKTYKDWGNQRQTGRSSKGERYAKNLDRLATFLSEHGCPFDVRQELRHNLENTQTYGRLFLAVLAVENALKKENIRNTLLEKKQRIVQRRGELGATSKESTKIDLQIADLENSGSEYDYLSGELRKLKKTLEEQGIVLDPTLDFSRASKALLDGPDITGDESDQQLNFSTLNRLWNEALSESCESRDQAYQNPLQTDISRIQHPLIVADRMCQVLSQSDLSSAALTREEKLPLLAQNKPSFRKSLERTLARNGLNFTMLKKSRKAAIEKKAEIREGGLASRVAEFAAGFLGFFVGAIAGPILGVMAVMKNADCGMEGIELILGILGGVVAGPFIGAYQFGKVAMKGVKAGQIKEKLSQAQEALLNNRESEAVDCLTNINCVTQACLTGDTWPQRESNRQQTFPSRTLQPGDVEAPSSSSQGFSHSQQMDMGSSRPSDANASYAAARNVGILSNAGTANGASTNAGVTVNSTVPLPSLKSCAR